jgi:acyl dehydratase
LDEAQIKAFARKFDPQPFHLDDEIAKSTMFGGLVASGWHTAAITMRLLVGGGAPIASFGLAEPPWRHPSGRKRSPGGEAVTVAPRQRHGYRALRDRNQRGEVVQVLTAKLVVPRRASA